MPAPRDASGSLDAFFNFCFHNKRARSHASRSRAGSRMLGAGDGQCGPARPAAGPARPPAGPGAADSRARGATGFRFRSPRAGAARAARAPTVSVARPFLKRWPAARIHAIYPPRERLLPTNSLSRTKRITRLHDRILNVNFSDSRTGIADGSQT